MGFCQSIGIMTSLMMSLEKSGVRYNFSSSLNFKLHLYIDVSQVYMSYVGLFHRVSSSEEDSSEDSDEAPTKAAPKPQQAKAPPKPPPVQKKQAESSSEEESSSENETQKGKFHQICVLLVIILMLCCNDQSAFGFRCPLRSSPSHFTWPCLWNY